MLNSCNSAKETDTNIGNMAAVLTQMGIENVIGMSFRVMASSVEVFMMPFYRAFLLQNIELTEAVWLARAYMRHNHMRPGRYAADYSVNDSCVPVLYQNHNRSVFWASEHPISPGGVESVAAADRLDLIGRDGDLLELEAMLNKYKIINIIGEPGVGKTAFVDWISDWWEESDDRKAVIVVDLCRLDVVPSFPTEDTIMIFDNAEYDVLLSHEELTRFLLGFRRTASQGSRLILVSRAKVPINIPRIKQYSLEPPAAKHANDIAHRVLQEAGFEHTGATTADAWLHELDEVLAEHHFNPLFTTVFAKQLAHYPESPTRLLEALQQGPMYMGHDINVVGLDESLAAGLAECQSDSVELFYDWITHLKAESKRPYEMLLSLAPFHGSCNFIPKYYLLKLHERGVLHFENIQLSVQSPIPPGNISSYPPELDRMLLEDESVMDDWRLVVRILTTIGLCKEEIVSMHAPEEVKRVKMLKIHPLLPYLLQYNPYIAASERSERSKALGAMFWEYYEFKCDRFFGPNLGLGPYAIQAIRLALEVRERDKTNILNAARLSLKQPQFGFRYMRSIAGMLLEPLSMWNQQARSSERITDLRLLVQMFDRYSKLSDDDSIVQRNDAALRLDLVKQFLSISLLRAMFLSLQGATGELAQEHATTSSAAMRYLGETDLDEEVKALFYVLECLSIRFDKRPFVDVAPRIEQLISMYRHNTIPRYSSWVAGAKLPLLTSFITQRNLTVEHQSRTKIMQALAELQDCLSCMQGSNPLSAAILGPELRQAIAMLDDLLSREDLPASCEIELLYPVLSPLRSSGVLGTEGGAEEELDRTLSRRALEQALDSAIQRRDTISEMEARNELFNLALQEKHDLDAVRHDDRIIALSDQILIQTASTSLRVEDNRRCHRHRALAIHYITKGMDDDRDDAPMDLSTMKRTYETAQKYLNSAVSLTPPGDRYTDILQNCEELLRRLHDKWQKRRDENLRQYYDTVVTIPMPRRSIKLPHCCE